MASTEPKKRGRKPKNLLILNEITNVVQEPLSETTDTTDITDEIKPPHKKRGRKPKGGKIILQQSISLDEPINKPNIILHLKCSLKDLHDSSIIQPNIDSFNFSNNNTELSYEIIGHNNNNININDTDNDINSTKIINEIHNNTEQQPDTKDIWKKLKQLERDLHHNNINDKKAACFWCTCDFDNPPVYIPKFFINNSYSVYGCFCSPECATSYLMKDNIDNSMRFERYHLLNHIYSKIYNYTKNIKPAPNPFYLLDKYYGNLTIQEYRAMLRSDRLFIVVDKPLTRVLPELHENNDDFTINNKIIPSNIYKINPNKSKPRQTKSNIMNETFGL